MNEDAKPSKTVLKRKYGITNDDFKILTQRHVPDADELKKDGHILQRVADWFGVPTYIIRSGVAVVAVILIPANLKTFQEELNNSLSFYSDMIQSFRNLPEPKKELPSMYFSHANIASSSSSIVTYNPAFPSGDV